MKKGSIIWGIILILIGLLILLRSFNIIYFSWWHFWRLWPLALIITGISIIPMKTWIKTVAMLIVVAIGLGLIIRPNNEQYETCFSRYFNDWNFDDSDWDDLKNDLKSELKKISEANYVTLFDDSVTTVNLTLELPECDVFSLKKSQKEGLLFNTVGIASFNLTNKTISPVANCSLLPFDTESELTKADLKLSPKYSYDIRIDTKSEYNNLDFSELNVSNLNMTASEENASWKLKFDKTSTLTTLHLTTNHSVKKIELTIPKNTGISVTANDFSKYQTWNRLKKAGDKFVSDNFNQATHKIEIQLDSLEDINFNIEEY